MKNLLLQTSVFLIFLIFLNACQSNDDPNPVVYGTLIDDRDGQEYRTIQIGSQTWMADNLNYETENSVCYDNKPENCQQHGKLYSYWEAMEACPSGWRLPSLDDYITLLSAIGGPGNGGSLKSREIWISPNMGGNNNSGFSALPSGLYNANTRVFSGLGERVEFWTSTTMGSGATSGRFFALYYDLGEAATGAGKNLTYGGSCRCIKD